MNLFLCFKFNFYIFNNQSEIRGADDRQEQKVKTQYTRTNSRVLCSTLLP